MSVRILVGDCTARLKDLPDNSVDSVVCDPPYHLTSASARSSKGFMGQAWDGGDVAFQPETWVEVLRVLKPGGHLIAFSGTRTYHRMTVAIEDAGFEVRDMIPWHYGSGFPKSHDVSKAIDKSAGAEREVIAEGKPVKRMIPGADQNKSGWIKDDGREFVPTETAPATDAAKQWEGWGTALKPATEPMCLARKPLSESSIAANVLKWGTGALNIDGCRIEGEARPFGNGSARHGGQFGGGGETSGQRGPWNPAAQGRWPANIVHDGSEEVVAGFPAEAGAFAPVHRRKADKTRNAYGAFKGNVDEAGSTFRGDSGSAARFFYCAKASQSERGEGNNHPTVKPVALMRWLVRLVTPPGGTVLDPFMGSGSTALACEAEQFNFIGCELSADYVGIAERRIRAAAQMYADISIEHAGPNTRAP